MNYVIAATMRTGTHLLGDLLKQVGLGEPGEYMQPRPGYVPEEYARLIAAGNRASEHTALVVFWGQLSKMSTNRPGEFLDETLRALEMDDPKFIHLYREDVVAQAASAERARQTGQWHATDPFAVKRPRLAYRPDHMEDLVDSFMQGNHRWRLYFEKRGIEALDLTYEYLSKMPRAALRTVTEFLGYSFDPRVHIEPRYVKLAGKETQALVDQWLGQHRNWWSQENLKE